MAHARAKLTVLGRQLLVDRVLIDGWKPADAAKAMGVSRQTAYKWLRRFRDEGVAGPRGPLLGSRGAVRTGSVLRRSSPSWPPDSRPFMGLTAWPMRSAGLDRPSTGCSAERRISRLSFIDRPTRTVVRYERERPGRAPPCRREEARPYPRGRWLEDAWSRDGHDRRAARDRGRVRLSPRGRRRPFSGRFRPPIPDEKGSDLCPVRAPMPLLSSPATGVTIERVMTDNARNYRTSRDLPAGLLDLGIAHRRTALSAPDQWQGGALQPHIARRVRLQEPLHLERRALKPLGPWVDSYNAERPHTAIGGLTPLQRLVNNADGEVPGRELVGGNDAQPAGLVVLDWPE